MPDEAAETPVEIKRHPLSPSAADKHKKCPRAWQLRYLHHEPDPSGLPALIGTFAHRVLELLMQRPAAQRTQETAKELARQAWDDARWTAKDPETAEPMAFHETPDMALHGMDEDGLKAFRWATWAAVVGLWKIEDPTKVEVIATERKLEVTLADTLVQGVIDRLDQTPEGVAIVDYKSGKYPDPRDHAAKLEQLYFYAAAVRAATGFTPVRVRLLYTTHGKEISAPVTEADLDRAEKWAASTSAEIDSHIAAENFPPKPSALCAWCSSWTKCAEGKEMVLDRMGEGKDGHSPAAALIASIPAGERGDFIRRVPPPIPFLPAPVPTMLGEGPREGEEAFGPQDQRPHVVWAAACRAGKFGEVEILEKHHPELLDMERPPSEAEAKRKAARDKANATRKANQEKKLAEKAAAEAAA